MSPNSALQITNLSYSYTGDWGGTKITALKPLDLEIFEGECFGYLGHNGAGKTTTIKCILGLISPKTGNIKIFGKNSQDHLGRLNVGYVPEQPYFYDHLSVVELLKYYGGLSALSGKQLLSKIDSVLKRLNIADRKDARMRTLSKGLTQKVALAQALLHDPKLLILDEPFSGLDPLGRREVRQVILEEKNKGKTIFLCSHVLSDVEALCSRASVLSKGQLKGIVDLGHTSSDRYQITILTSSGTEELVSCSNQEQLHAELKKLLEAKSTIVSVEKISKTLEERFVELINN